MRTASLRGPVGAAVAGAAARPRAAAALAVDELRGHAAFAALREEWNATLAAGPVDAPFSRHEWLAAWLAAFAAGEEPIVLAARDPAGRAQGFAAFLARRERGARVLAAPANDHSCRVEWALGADATGAAAAIWRHLRDRLPWDVLLLRDVPREGPTSVLLEAAARGDGHPVGRWESQRSPYLPLAGGDVEAGLSSKFLANLRRRLKRLGEHGAVAYARVDGAEGLEPFLRRFFHLEAAGWKGRRGTAIAADQRLVSFYSSVARAAAAGGWLALRELTLDGRPAAMHFALRYRGTYYLPKPAYDEGLGACSPGQLLFREVLAECAARRLGELDLLGPDMPWKRDWQARLRAHDWLYVYRPGPTGWALHAARHRLRPLAKEVLRWWRR
jgi:CelD/BcsL family acetyltransferase involved in cellulose biosynthesis